MKIDVILGLQWGDEGKGKIVDFLTPHYDIIARFQGGPNAGHTLEFEGGKHVLHTIPSGIFHREKINLIGNGVLIDAQILMKEVELIRQKGFEPTQNMKISCKAHFIIPTHRLLDAAYEQGRGDQKIGSTLKGIGPAYTDKTSRKGLRVGDLKSDSFVQKYNALKNTHIQLLEGLHFDWKNALIDNIPFDEYEQLWMKAAEQIKAFELVHSEYFLNDALNKGKKVLAEGAQGSLLDIDFGTYPFVTSSNTLTAGVCTGLGVSPACIGKVYGVFKAYCTRVGSGPFPTELHDETGEKLRTLGHEFGSTTGRPRRCGWLDLPALKYTIMLNGVTDLIVTKIDVLDTFEEIKICDQYEIRQQLTAQFPDTDDVELATPHLISVKGWNIKTENIKEIKNLPDAFMDYLRFIEKETQKPISIISTGPDRSQTIVR